MTTFLKILAILGGIGVPTLFSLVATCFKKVQKCGRALIILQSAQKAQMRSQMLKQYYFYIQQGWIYSDDLDDWMNQYKAYHTLEGENGVLDSRKDELIKLPSKNAPMN